MHLFWLLVLISLLLDRFVGVSLLLLTVVFASWELPGNRAWIVAFLLGLVESVMWIRALGIPSAVFVLVAAVVWVWRQQVEAYRGLAVFVSGVLAETVYRLVWGEAVRVVPILLAGALLYVVWWVRQRSGWGREVYLR